MGPESWGRTAPSDDVYARLEALERLVREALPAQTIEPPASRLIPVSPAPFVPDRAPSVHPNSFAMGRAKMVRKMILSRRRRERHFDAEIFADPAWDMLLDLYAAHYERQRVSVSSLCIAAAVPATTALRWIKTMCDTGKFLRAWDPDDGRRIFISLSEEARLKMDAYFDDFEEK